MTQPVEPHELSGLLDGELDSQRVAEIRRAIDTDAELRSQFDRLIALDRAWSVAAHQAAFRPSVSLPTGRWTVRHVAAVALGLVILLAIRFLPKMLDAPIAFGIVVHMPILAGVVAGLIWVVRDMDKQWSATVQPSLPEAS